MGAGGQVFAWAGKAETVRMVCRKGMEMEGMFAYADTKAMGLCKGGRDVYLMEL